MTDRADGQYDPLVAERRFEQLAPFVDDLLHREPAADEFRLGLPVAVGDDLTGRAQDVDPCRAEGDDEPVAARQLAAAEGQGVADAVQRGLRVGRVEEGAGAVVEPAAVGAAVQFVRAGWGAARGAADECGDRCRVEERAGGVAGRAEFGGRQPAGHLRGEARSQQQQPVAVADRRTERFGGYLCAEFHGTKIGKMYEVRRLRADLRAAAGK